MRSACRCSPKVPASGSATGGAEFLLHDQRNTAWLRLLDWRVDGHPPHTWSRGATPLRRRRHTRLRDLDMLLRTQPLDLPAVRDALRRVSVIEPVDKRISAAVIGVLW
jgi:hypothetical protein